uniref:Supervillin n=1 Tax=Schistosoma mansoni TaxID=6183 RepID=A0A5K4F3P0_SCHMA
MDNTKTSPQRKFRQIIQPHEHNFSVPSFGYDFRNAFKTNEKNTIQQQSPTDTTSELKKTMKLALATVNQPRPINSVIAKTGPSVDQTADFTYASRPQLKDMHKELRTSSLRRQNFNERQVKLTEGSVSDTPSTKSSIYRPGSMYLPKSKNDHGFTEQNMNSERAGLSQPPESKQLNSNTGYAVGTEGQFVHSSLQRTSSLGRNSHKSVPASNPVLQYSGLPGISENSTVNEQFKPDLQYSHQMTTQMDYPQWLHHQQQRLQPSQPQETINQPIQQIHSLHSSGWTFPQNTVASSQVHSSAPNNQTSCYNSSSYNPANNVGEFMFTVPPTVANIGDTSSQPGVIPQSYILTPDIASFPYSQTSERVSGPSTQPVHQSQLLPGTTVLQPQVAIVTVDPEILKAILSGAFNTQALFQSVNMSSSSKPGINMTSSINLPTQKPDNSNTDSVPLSVTRTYCQPSEPQNVVVPESSISSDTKKEDKSLQNLCCPNDTESRSLPFSYNKTEDKSNGNQEPIGYSNGLQPIQNSSSDKPQKSAPRIGNPPRTLRFLDKSESCEPGSQMEDSHHSGLTGGREPRKLKPSSFIFRSRKASTDESPNLRKNETNEYLGKSKADNNDTVDQRQEVSSISAYYEQLKRRNSRPLSACKLTAATQFQPPADPSLLKTSEFSSNFESSPVNCRSAHQLTRGYTVASSKPDHAGLSTGFSKEGTHLRETDPSIMTVAERAKQWLLAQSSGYRETQRYSTSGFIDQDLVDCQDLVPVEDRVKMFDIGASLGQQTEKSPEVKSELQELCKKKQVKFGENNLQKPDSSPKSTNLTNKSVTSVTLQNLRPNHVNPRRPHSSVNLHRIKQESVQTGVIQPAIKTSQGVNIVNSSLKIAPVKGVQQSNGDELTRLSLNEKRSLFSQRFQQGQQSLTNKPFSVTTEPKRVIRRKTQPITLDDLAKANQLILEKYYGKHLESPFGSVKGDEQDSFGFHEYDSQISTPEASLRSRYNENSSLIE